MVTLHLIRHGRASAHEANYDKLHELGVRQARLLGAHQARRGPAFSRVFVGPLVRQRGTLAAMREAAAELGVRWPKERVLDALAEAPFGQLFKQILAPRVAHEPELLQAMRQLEDAREVEAMRSAMTPLYTRLQALWQSGEAGDGVESYAAFRARVRDAGQALLADAAPGEHVAAITSTGVIGALLDEWLCAAAAEQVYATRLFANTSVTALRADGRAFRLLAAEQIQHLTEPALVTVL